MHLGCIYIWTDFFISDYNLILGKRHFSLALHSSTTFKTVVLSVVSQVQLMKRWKRRATVPLLSSLHHLFLFWSPLVLHLKPPWLILLSLPSYLSPTCRLSSAPPPSCCVARRTAPHSSPRGGRDGGDTKSFDAAVCGDSIWTRRAFARQRWQM